jgi:hypothetical protein
MKIFLPAVFLLFCLGSFVSRALDSKADITGIWHFVLDTEGGDRTMDLTFKQNGDKIMAATKDGDHEVKYADGKFDLEFPMTSDEVGPGTLKLKGQLAEGVLSGNWSFQDYSGTFKATRAAAP